MIKGDFDQVNIVARALDAEGNQCQEEPTENVGRVTVRFITSVTRSLKPWESCFPKTATSGLSNDGMAG